MTVHYYLAIIWYLHTVNTWKKSIQNIIQISPLCSLLSAVVLYLTYLHCMAISLDLNQDPLLQIAYKQTNKNQTHQHQQKKTWAGIILPILGLLKNSEEGEYAAKVEQTEKWQRITVCINYYRHKVWLLIIWKPLKALVKRWSELLLISVSGFSFNDLQQWIGYNMGG